MTAVVVVAVVVVVVAVEEEINASLLKYIQMHTFAYISLINLCFFSFLTTPNYIKKLLTFIDFLNIWSKMNF